jgi:hypothetical protein
MLQIVAAVTGDRLNDARSLFEEYAASLGIDLDFSILAMNSGVFRETMRRPLAVCCWRNGMVRPLAALPCGHSVRASAR